jgi:hypothetical protein
MSRASSFESPRLAGAIAITLGLYASVGLCFAAALYWLMQPRVIDNPGLAAYRPAPGTVIDYAASRVAPAAPPVAAAPPAAPRQEPDVTASTVSTSPASPATKHARRQAGVSARVRRPAPQRRDPMRDFAYQPAFGFRTGF